MNGLVAYDYDSPSDTEDGAASTSKEGQNTNDHKPKASVKPLEATRRLPKSQVIIKRPAINHKNQNIRTHISDDLARNDDALLAGPSTSTTQKLPMIVPSSSSCPSPSEEPQDQVSRFRTLMQPKPIPGIEDWGIPPETTEQCEASLQTQFARFSALKLDPQNPKHYNDSLMSNRSFRNPHLYAQLVNWVDVDERTTNFPKDIWDPENVKPDWFASQIADAQKERSEKQAAAQTAGKRSHIDFASSSSTSASKDRDRGHAHGAQARKSRFQPYGVPALGGGSSASAPVPNRDRQKTRWG